MSPFGAEAQQIVAICGLHRLATGTGVRLLEDLDFREAVLKDAHFNFPSSRQIGVLAFKVVLRADNRSWRTHARGDGKTAFRWSPTKALRFEILFDPNPP